MYGVCQDKCEGTLLAAWILATVIRLRQSTAPSGADRTAQTSALVKPGCPTGSLEAMTRRYQGLLGRPAK